MRNYKFSNEINAAFEATLKKRINQFFIVNNIGKKANHFMVIKSMMAFAFYLIPFAVIVLLAPDSLILLFALWIAVGFGYAFIGTSVMHDSLHGSYSGKMSINRFIGSSSWLIGVNATNWKIQHNILHHTYPNVDHVDEDIEPKYFFRFSPNQTRRWFHRYQHVYAIFFYSLSTLQWVLVKDFIKAFKYRKKGLIKNEASFRRLLAQIILGKLLYFSLFLVMPILVLPVSTGMVVIMFVTMHITSGLLLSFIFQCAHVMPSSKFIEQESDVINENRLVHQLNTTTNFGVNSKLLGWFGGNLNHQIEHHLCTDICHIHYRKISKIVRKTTKEFELPYAIQSSFGDAIISHLKMLKYLGSVSA